MMANGGSPDYKKYAKAFDALKLSQFVCARCGFETHSASTNSFCNFCEQYASAAAATRPAFLDVHAYIKQGNWEDAAKKVEELLKTDKNTETFYLSGLFYAYFSNLRYRKVDYGAKGFMDTNAENIRAGLDLVSKSKEHLFGAISLVAAEPKKGVQPDQDALFIKFMSEMKLRRFVDASKTIKTLQGAQAEYAEMAYGAQTGSKSTPGLEKLLARNEVNAFYYLAEHLARQKELGEAAALLRKLNDRINLFMAQELLNRVVSVQEASKP